MADGLSSFSVVIGAALAGGWAATIGKAKSDVGGITDAERRMRELTRANKPLDLTALDANKKATAASKKALDDYRASMVQIGPPTEEQAATLKLLEAAHNRHEKAVKRSSAAIAATEARLKSEGKDVAKVRAEYERQHNTLERSIALQKSWNRAVDSGRRVGKMFAVSGALLAGAGRGLFAIAEHAANWAGEIVDNAEKLGMSTRALQEWQFAASTAGMDAEKFNGAVWKLSLGLDDALRNKGSAAGEAIRRLGLNLRVLSALPADKRMNAISDALSRISDPDARASITSALFGKDAAKDMADLLGEGSARIAELRAEAEKMGLIFDPKKVAPLKKSLAEVRYLVAGVGRAIGVALAPKIGELVEQVKKSGPALIKLGTDIGKTLANVAPVLVKIMGAAGSLFATLAKYPALAKTLAVGMGAFGLSLGAWKLWQFASAAIAVGKALWALRSAQIVATAAQWALNTSLWANPIGAIVAGVLALVAAIGLLIWKWKEVNAWLDKHKLIGEVLMWESGIGLGVKAVRSYQKGSSAAEKKGTTLFRMPGRSLESRERRRKLHEANDQRESTPSLTIPTKIPSLVIPERKAAQASVRTTNNFHITQQPGEDTETLAQRIASLIDRQQRGLLDSALADIA